MARYNPTRNQMVPGDPDDDLAYTANGAIAISHGVHALAKTSIGAFTLAAPAVGDDGIEVTITSRTTFAHVVTVAGGVAGKGAGFTLLTFAEIGDTIRLIADAGHWAPIGAPYGVVIS